MSVMIRGMEMPSGCNTCQLHVLCFDYYVCRAKKLEHGGYLDVDDKVIEGRRHRCCPLVEIPTPHGRLIDADALLRVIEENSYRLRGVTNSTENGMFLTGIRQAIDESPTIIEAEVSE